MTPDPIGNALNRLREQLDDTFATRGTDAGMTPEEAERYAGPPPGPAELEELSALAGDVAGLPVMVLCPEGYQVPLGASCAACPVFATCPGRSP